MPSSKFWKNKNGRTEWYWQDLVFAELQILKKWKWPYLLNRVEYCDEILYTHWYGQDVDQTIVKCHLGLPRRCRGSNSEKQWNWPYLMKLFEYFDKIMHKHCYWRELDRGVAKCHLSSVEAMPRSKLFSIVRLAEWCRTVILSDGTFNLHKTTIMDYFSCILFLRQLHLGLNMYSFINFMQSRNNYIFQWRKFVCVR